MRAVQEALRIFLALWLAVAPVKAWAGSMTLLGVGKSSAMTFSLALTDHQEEASGGTTISYSACANGVTTCNFGATDPNRIIVVCAGARMATVNTLSSMTIGGVTATLVSGTIAQISGTNGSNSACYQASGVSGTSGTVSITWGAAAARTGIAIFRLVTSAPTANSSDAKSSLTTITNGTLTILAGGSGIAFSFQNSTTTVPTWANSTSIYQAVAGSTSEVSAASVAATSSAISAGVNASQVMSLASWGP